MAGQPAPFAIAEVPVANPRNMGASERRHTISMIHSMAHWQKTVEGYSGFRPRLHEQLYDELTSFPDERSLRSLSQLGVTYVVVHTAWYSAEDWAAVERRIASFRDRLTLAHVDGEGRVYTVTRPASTP